MRRDRHFVGYVWAIVRWVTFIWRLALAWATDTDINTTSIPQLFLQQRPQASALLCTSHCCSQGIQDNHAHTELSLVADRTLNLTNSWRSHHSASLWWASCLWLHLYQDSIAFHLSGVAMKAGRVFHLPWCWRHPAFGRCDAGWW